MSAATLFVEPVVALFVALLVALFEPVLVELFETTLLTESFESDEHAATTSRNGNKYRIFMAYKSSQAGEVKLAVHRFEYLRIEPS